MNGNNGVDEVIDDSIDVFLEKGIQALNDQNDFQLALNYFHNAEILSPNNAAIQNNLAVCYWNLREKKKAIEHATQSVRLSPFEMMYVLNCGDILTAEKKNGQAISIYKNFLKKFPDCEEVKNVLNDISSSIGVIPSQHPAISDKYVDYTPTYASAVIPAFNGLSNKSIQMLVQESILSGESILDVGCGIGDYLRYTNPSQRVVAVEPHTPYVEKAVKKYPWVEFHNTDAISFLEQTQEKFDTIIIMDVAEHLELKDAVTMVQLAVAHCKKVLLLQTPFGIHPQDHDLWGCDGEFWQTHRTTWDSKNLNSLGLRFYTVWENWYHWDKSESDKSPDLVLGMWIPEDQENRFSLIVDSNASREEFSQTIASIKRQTYPLFDAYIICDDISPEKKGVVENSVGTDSRFSICDTRNNQEMELLIAKTRSQGSDTALSIKAGLILSPEYLSDKYLSLQSGDTSVHHFSPKNNSEKYLKLLKKQNYEMWQQAFRDGYNSSMGDHRNYFYNRFIQEIGFYEVLSESSRIAEFGPGDASFISHFISECPEKDFYLVDIAEKNLDAIKQKLSLANNVGYFIDGIQTPSMYDIDLCFSFLLCQSMPYTLWREHLVKVHTMLSPKGKYIFQFAYHSDGSVNDSLGDSIAGNQKYHPDQMVKLLETTGYTNIKLTHPITLTQFQSDILWFLCSAEKL